jgi:hypothetical protein
MQLEGERGALLVAIDRDEAHAELFIGHASPEIVFAPIERWLRERS